MSSPAKQGVNQRRNGIGKGGTRPPPGFVKGQSGNTRGRPKKLNIIDEMRKLVEAGAATPIAKKMLSLSRKGNVKAAAIVLDRLYGKVPFRVAGPDGGPIKVVQVTEPDKI